MFEQDIGARLGGLMSYGPDFEDIFRRAGRYAGRVLKGGNPAEMAMEEPRQFRFVLNMKTAREIGLEIPPAVRLRADEVIE
jgi:putative ABC transport system substrate-binding protein